MEAQTSALRVALKLPLVYSSNDFNYWNIQIGFYLLLWPGLVYALNLQSSLRHHQLLKVVHFEPTVSFSIDHFTVSCLVASPLNESEAGGDLVLIETSLLFSC